MKIIPRFLYLFCFLGMAVAAALSLDRALQPSMSTILLRAVIMGGVLGAAGLVHRKAWGVSLVLLPIGAYVLSVQATNIEEKAVPVTVNKGKNADITVNVKRR